MMTRRSAIAAAILPFALAAGQAQALEVGETKTFADMEAALESEGQRKLADSWQDTGNKLRGIRYTRNPQDKTAYIIIANKPLDSNPTRAVVFAKLVNTEQFDPRVPGVPAGVKLPTSSAAALAECEKVRKEDEICGSLKDMLAHADKQGIGVLLQGEDVIKKSDGTRTMWTITAKMRKSSADDQDLLRKGRALLTNMPGGSTTNMYGFLPLQTKLASTEDKGQIVSAYKPQ